jgi:hypothetical protein
MFHVDVGFVEKAFTVAEDSKFRRKWLLAEGIKAINKAEEG